ncbi:MAG: hypothetical protein CBC40_04000 [bacterium TMED80]|nr:MAG: hypothetical protein CBC40_04000 [bacterium TMED80]
MLFNFDIINLVRNLIIKLKKLLKSTLTVIVFTSLFMAELSACKIWATMLKSGNSFSSLAQEEQELIQFQMSAYYDQSQYNANGWSIIQYEKQSNVIENNIYRSAYPAVQDSANYWQIMNSVLNDSLHNIAVAHLRAATSGASSIQNPHPWIFESDSVYSFVHNGGASKDVLYDIITDYGNDESWLIQNPPQTYGNGDWQDEGWNSVVDSELIMLLIMKEITAYGSVIEGLQSALSKMLSTGIYPSMLNFVFSDSKSLFVYGGNSGLKIMESNSYYSIMSSPPSNQQLYAWQPINSNELNIIKENSITRYQTFASTSIEQPDVILPESAKLHSPYPNPFNGKLSIPFDVNISQLPNISIYNIKGNRVFTKNLSRNDISRGKIYWNVNDNETQNPSSGIYIVKLLSKTNSESSKIMFIK